MKVAFVGVRRKFSEIDADYHDKFLHYHLEIPYYYARDGANEVYVTTVDHEGSHVRFGNGGSIRCVLEERLADHGPFDVIVHWRKWFDEFSFSDGEINVLHTCDHSYSKEWLDTVVDRYRDGRLKGILCYRSWHQQNLLAELEGKVPVEHLWTDMTLGVDTDVYKPDWTLKDPYQLLWSSDPGRGLQGAAELAIKLHARDRRFKLHVCYPDYVNDSFLKISHPAIVWHGKIPNGPELWNLFNTSGVLPYTSTFKEPSSRAHRQAMSSGCFVLYPENMGSPSYLLTKETGHVGPVDGWVDKIYREVSSGGWMTYGYAAREYAISENWRVQAERFNRFFETRTGKR